MDNKSLWLAIFIGGFMCALLGGIAAWQASPPSVTQTAPAPSSPTYAAKPQLPAGVRINTEQALQTAQQTLPQARFNPPELVRFDGQLAYEVNSDVGAVYIDAQNNTVLSQPTLTPPASRYAQNRPYQDDDEGEEDEDDDDKQEREHDDG